MTETQREAKRKKLLRLMTKDDKDIKPRKECKHGVPKSDYCRKCLKTDKGIPKMKSRNGEFGYDRRLHSGFNLNSDDEIMDWNQVKED